MHNFWREINFSKLSTAIEKRYSDKMFFSNNIQLLNTYMCSINMSPRCLVQASSLYIVKTIPSSHLFYKNDVTYTYKIHSTVNKECRNVFVRKYLREGTTEST